MRVSISRVVRTLWAGVAVAVAAGLVACPSAWADGGTQSVLRATLKNGLKVVIVRDTMAPVVSTSINYLVGSDEAPEGFPGMAHAQEHMMFRGSPGLSAAQLAEIGGMMGGDFNADTQESVTQYLFTVPADDIDVALRIGAIRMQGVNDSAKDWAKERGAIEQEVARDMSSPEYVLYTKLRAAMFAGTPYAHDALGTRPSFDKTTAAMLHRFYERWYAPNNAVLVIVGDLDPARTLAEIRRLYSGVPAKSLPPRPAYHPQPIKPVTLTMPTDQPTASTVIAMRMPGPSSPDFPALEVLADVLSSRRGALYAMVPEGKALQTDFELSALPKASLAYAAASYPASANAAAVKQQILKVLKDIREHGVPPDLVAAAKLQEKTQAGVQKQSIEGLASLWSEALTVYHLPSPDADLKRIEKVTVADVDRVARKYLDLSHTITLVTKPRGAGAPVVSGGFGGQEAIVLPKEKAPSLPSWAKSALAKLHVPHSTLAPSVSMLPNGLTLIVQPEYVSDTISVYGHVKNRQQTEAPADKQGVGGILDQLFDFGTTSMNRLQFQAALDAIGATESAGSDFGLNVPVKKFRRGVALLAQNELEPALPPVMLNILKEETAQVLAQREHAPDYLTDVAIRKALFPPSDPTLRQATPKTVLSLTMNDVKGYYHTVFRPDLTTIVVMGPITPVEARKVIERYFGGWQAHGPKPQTELPKVPPNRPTRIAVPDPARVQDRVVMAETVGLTRSDPDYYALNLGNAVLGGGFYSTRLSIDLRKNAGLVYSVNSELVSGKTRSIYLIAYASDPQNVSKASLIATTDLKSMLTAPPSAGELLQAKALLLRQIPLNEASFGGIAQEFIHLHDMDLPLDEPTIAARRYLAISAQDVQAAFRKWVRPADMIRVSEGPSPK
ncbi:MAG: insulinase family protein [Alphaproteobacteria bacterium]|nr:insulinase family protein [Alphaproteobacteria bacterium]